jgi:hypothetical protein
MLIIRTGKLKGTYRNESFIFDDAMTETEIVEKVEQLVTHFDVFNPNVNFTFETNRQIVIVACRVLAVESQALDQLQIENIHEDNTISIEQLDETGSFTNNGQFYDSANKNLVVRLIKALNNQE